MKYEPDKPRILVAFGGRSSERAVSIETGQAVAYALERNGYPTAVIDIGTGRILQTPELDNVEKDPTKIPQVVDLPLEDIARHFSLTVIAMHGGFGEGGGLQDLLEQIGMPYLGSQPASSAVALDKRFTKEVFAAAKIKTPDYQIVTKPEEVLTLPFPVVVKPVDNGSSYGIAICENEADYQVGVKNAFGFSQYVLVEKYIKGQELTVAILEGESGEPQALPVIEIIPKNRFFDQQAKYDGTTQEIVPAKIPDELAKKASGIALQVHKALYCRHLSRVDMMVDSNGEIYVLELNTLPGMTDESLFPKAAKAAGYDFDKLMDHFVKIALKG
jgi:D-alanine-D-alanine ligase